jgi:Putative DNA-binding domain
VIDGPLTTIDKPQLQKLVGNKVHEGRTLDYKRDLSFSDEDKRELARDISSFANAIGGDLVFGVEEAKDEAGKNLGYPAKLVGISMIDNFETLRQRIENIIGSTLEPRIAGLMFHQVAGFERGPIVIVRVPRSWAGPHMLVPHKHFYSRNSVGKYPLDVREIGNLFTASTELEARVRTFRNERLGRILAGETPVVLALRPKAVIHLVPLTHDPSFRLDLQALAQKATQMQPMAMGPSMNWRFNLDGFVTYAGPDTGPQRTYAQAFRNGSFEAVNSLRLDDSRTPQGLRALKLEQEICEVTQTFLRILREAGMIAPGALLIALLGVRATSIYHGSVDEDQRDTIDRDTVILPDILLEMTEGLSLTAALRPAFDALWQASGWERSMGYDQRGSWVEQLHNR